ncbi:Manganese transport system membrane protein MntB [Novipirellula galeiformis]|uniref:Manganese transport system membrane protein MntB n=1 Tax=Novipirellula galeiformis TaxID=2528004 RepID=A0A5C6CPQ0_9BACT|nr:iron chelate uptake ABC transporter family permease subunit [Novipirellula galeiformis]TWU25371.1 Manganese transport system membrane protein MntB [Novipirellula galeiformis]
MNAVAILSVGVLAAGNFPFAQVVAAQSITDRRLQWPSWEQWTELLLLQQYNTRVVILGVALLGCAAGMVGSFTLLRKRALMGDALSHATLPGIVLAFLIATWVGADGKSLPILLSGATITGLLGLAVILLLRHATRLKEDTALGAVLSVFFGGGMALLGVSQQMQQGHVAGLESFIYGKTASMGLQDVRLIGFVAAGCIGACLLLFKEFKLLCFDEGFAGARGFPTIRLDIALMGLVVTVCIVGLQAVGLILVIALLIIPAAAARFWTEKLWAMFLISGLIGAISGMLGGGVSALFSRLPSGAMIVLVCTAFFLLSMLLGTSRGVLVRSLRRRRLNRAIDRQHLLRAAFELSEAESAQKPDIKFAELLDQRSWSPRRLRRAIRRARRSGMLLQIGERIGLTKAGFAEAARLTRQHRLWELFLITYADVAPSRVDRQADAIEHVLEPELVRELEAMLDRQDTLVPPSPHPLTEVS